MSVTLTKQVQLAGSHFDRSARIVDSRSFRQVFSKSKRFGKHGISVLVRRNQSPCSRLGLAISKKQIKRAVDRNRIKRLTRESFRLYCHQSLKVDAVVIVKTAVLKQDNRQILIALEQLWQNVNQYFNK